MTNDAYILKRHLSFRPNKPLYDYFPGSFFHNPLHTALDMAHIYLKYGATQHICIERVSNKDRN